MGFNSTGSYPVGSHRLSDRSTGRLFREVVNSEIGYRGIVKKICIFFMVAIAQVLDLSAGLGNPWIRSCVIMFFIANESLSALENMGRMGVPLPEPLMAALEKLHKDHSGTKK